MGLFTPTDIHPIITEKQKIFGVIQEMEIKYIKKKIELDEISNSVNDAQEQQSLKQKIITELGDMESKIREKIKKIIQLNKKILNSTNDEKKKQLRNEKFYEELNDFEERFTFIKEMFTFIDRNFEPYGKNTNSPPKSGGKSRRRRAKSSKRTKRSKARKSGKKSSKRSTRKTRRNRRSKH
jgi:TolA-binding protein